MIEKKDMSTLLNLLQVVVLTLGLGGIFMKVGVTDATISHNVDELVELKGIVQDLAKSQIESVSNDSRHVAQIEEIASNMNSADA